MTNTPDNDPVALGRVSTAITYDLEALSPKQELVLSHMNSHYTEPLVSSITFTDQLIMQLPILLKHVSQETMSLYSKCTVLVSIGTKTFLGNSNVYKWMFNIHVKLCHLIGMFP